MNENINLVEILKDCPVGTKLYSSVLGEVVFKGIKTSNESYPIQFGNYAVVTGCTSNGCYFVDDYGKPIGECVLFPSRDQRDWSKFKAPKKEVKFEPFQKVLVRDGDSAPWHADIFSNYVEGYNFPHKCVGSSYRYCIPYEGNEHLLGTTNTPEE